MSKAKKEEKVEEVVEEVTDVIEEEKIEKEEPISIEEDCEGFSEEE